jgi:hypothetical protein
MLMFVINVFPLIFLIAGHLLFLNDYVKFSELNSILLSYLSL